MKIILYLSIFISTTCLAQNNDINISLIGNLSYTNNCNDIWGYVDGKGTEYALVGTTVATSIVSLADPAQPIEVDVVQGTNSVWRDIKVHNHYAYVTADRGTDGLLIIDLSTLPDSIREFKFWKPTLDVNGIPTILQTCHNLYIENGFIYLAGCNVSNQGVLVLDANTDPMNPQFVGAADITYSHDAFVRDNLLYTSEIYEGNMGIYNLGDKSNPTLLATQPTSRKFTHNVWSSDDNQVAFTTDEKADGFVDAYDISDMDQIARLDRYSPIAAKNQNVIPHNTHFMNDYLITSWYTEGVIIVDASNPNNLIRTGQYDTWSGPHGGFNGCWGAYPYLPSGLLLASDISTGLYILQPEYKRAAHLMGEARDIDSNSPINNVAVDILSDIPNSSTTDALGIYKTGQFEEGRFLIVASHPTYESDTVEIDLISGENTIVNFSLKSLEVKRITGLLTNAGSGNPIANAQIRFELPQQDFTTSADENGAYSIEVFEGQAKIYVGKLGFQTIKLDAIINREEELDFSLSKGIMDDFNFDFGWTIEGNATSGNWIRAIPQATFLASDEFANPGEDIPDDIGKYAFVTGNMGSDPGADDVDNGSSILLSPILDLTEYQDPVVSFYLWFFNGGGDSTPNDVMEISMSDGNQSYLIEEIRDNTRASGRWREKSEIVLSDYFTDFSKVQVSIKISDESPGHVVEGGFDGFLITEGRTTATVETEIIQGTSISPNPFTEYFQISSKKGVLQSVQLKNIQGQIVRSYGNINSDQFEINTSDLAAGAYFLQTRTKEGEVLTNKLVKVTTNH